MQVFLEAIQFNHDPDSATCDAFGIRRNESKAVTIPEWERGRTFKPEDSPAAYARNEIGNNTLTIKANFSCDAPGKEIWIRAVDGRINPVKGRGVRLLMAALRPLLRKTLHTNVLGEVSAKRVQFLNRQTGFEDFELQNVRIQAAGVGVDDVVWLWQFSHNNRNWRRIATTTHRIYTVLELPGPPWDPNSNNNSNTQLPWTGVLDHACRWAAGTTDVRESAFQITKSINLLGPAFIRYDKENNGGPHFTPDHPPRFDCQRLLNLLKSGSPRYHGLVNCDDCAAMVCTFANVLGCSFPESSIGSPKSPQFSLRRHKKIGLKWENFDQFDYHVIAWNGVEQDEVADACLLLDGGDGDSSEPKPLIASKMPFVGEEGYWRRLALAGEVAELQQKFSRQIGLGEQPVGPAIIEAKRQALLLVDAFSRIPEIFGWQRIDLRYVPEDIVEIYWQIGEGPNQPVLRLDIQVAATEKATRDNLIHQLGRFELPNVRAKEDAGFGGKLFANDSGFVILFSRDRFVCLLRNVGTTLVPMWEVAQIIDNFLRSLSTNH